MFRRYLFLPVLFIFMTFLYLGCEEDIVNTHGGDDPEETYTDLETRIGRNNEYALELYGKVTEVKDGNFMISPHSTEIAFAMVYAGARGQTEIEISEVMNFNYPQENGFHDAMSLLNDELCGRSGDWFTIKIANGCWIDNGFEILQAFQDTLTYYYDLEMDTLDFEFDPESSRETINDWVYDKTDHWIEDAFPPGSITPSSVMVLANTFCFQAKWLKCFDEYYTDDGYFYLLDGSTVTVPLMEGEDNFETYDGDGYSVIRLPYEGELVSMLIILPDEGNFEAFEAGLDGAFLVSLYDSLEMGFVHLTLPRWSISTDLNLKQILFDMGMTTAFAPGADFSGIDGSNDGSPWISTVVHKTEMWVNEHGTGAYAMTGMVLTVGIMPHFDAIRPFIFAIVDEPTMTIMFVGRVMEANGGPPPWL